MKIALCCWNMGKPVVSFANLLARLSRLALEHQDCDVLVLPEYLGMQTLDFSPVDLRESEEVAWMAEAISAFNLADAISGLARKYDMAILAGSWPVMTKDGYVNRAHFINEDGVLAVQDKISLTDEEQDRMGWYLKPGKSLDIFEFMGVKCAIAICHDTAKHQEFKEMYDNGVELVFMPSMCEFEGNDKTVDGHKWIFSHAKMRSCGSVPHFACVGSVGTQIIGDRAENNVGGAALYTNGVTVAEIGPFSKGRGSTAYVLKVEVNV
jgi:predicted amidohydrolase